LISNHGYAKAYRGIPLPPPMNGNSIENEYIPPFLGGHMHGLTAGKIQMGYWDPIEKCPPPLPPPHQKKKG